MFEYNTILSEGYIYKYIYINIYINIYIYIFQLVIWNAFCSNFRILNKIINDFIFFGRMVMSLPRILRL